MVFITNKFSAHQWTLHYHQLLLADITLQDLEDRVIETLPIRLSFLNVDDYNIVTAVPTSMQDTILADLNSVHPRLKFTMEESTNNTLNFLDVTIINNGGTIEFDWYHKPTFSRYLNYESHHFFYQKRGTVIGLVDRAFLLSHPRFYKKNLHLIIKILLNSYPLGLIFRIIKSRLKTNYNRANSSNIVVTKEVEKRLILMSLMLHLSPKGSSMWLATQM